MTTQRAIFNYEEVIDLHTESRRVSVIGIHTPTGDTPRKLCPGFFDQFKKYKYVGCSISLIPAATLPADPAQVSISDAGEPEIDARDLMNPVMFHGCHGNDLGSILNRIYTAGMVGGSDLSQIISSDSTELMSLFNADDDGDPILDVLESLYYRALTDNTWKKAHIQRGFRKSGLKPRIYSLATNMQIQNAGSLGGGYLAPAPFDGNLDIPVGGTPSWDISDPAVNPIRYFTPRTVPLGWLDTRQVVPYSPSDPESDVSYEDLNDTIKGMISGKTVWNELPKVFMGVILLPPAYKTEFYFRMVINHTFAFAGFRGISMSNDMLDMPPNYENWNELLSDDESDPDPPEPEPDPPEPPTGYPLVALSTLGSGGYKKAMYYRTSEDTDPSELSVSGSNNRFLIGSNPSSPDYQRIALAFTASAGDYFNSNLVIRRYDDTKLQIVVNGVGTENYITNASDLVDFISENIPNDYFAKSRGTDLFEMFITQNLTTPNSRGVSKWTLTQARYRSSTEMRKGFRSALADLVPIPRLRPSNIRC